MGVTRARKHSSCACALARPMLYACAVPSAPLADARSARPLPSRSGPVRAGQRHWRPVIAAYVELTKPRITLLLLVTCVAAMLAAAQGMPPLGLALVTALGLALSSGGASALNHVLDRDIDALMRRTSQRPVVVGTVSARAGTAFGSVLMVLAAVVLGLGANLLTAALATVGGLFYVLVYTVLLKRATPQNIVIGGAAGAVPPLVGWAAVVGGLDAGAWVMFAIVFMWTPPHFWALALLIREDYTVARVPMLPVVAGERVTVDRVWWYSVGLVATTLVPVAIGQFGWVYAIAATLLGGWLLVRAGSLRRAARAVPTGQVVVGPGTAGHAAARRLFLFSMAYLAGLFLAVVLDQAVLRLPIAG